MVPNLIARSQERPRYSRDRRPRSFHGHVEFLEGRTLLSFGTGGIVTTQVIGNGGSQAFAIAIQPADQKIIAGGDVQPNASQSAAFGLVRYNTDGTLDSTFGSKGVVTTAFNKSDFDEVDSVVVQPGDGKILAGGTDIYFDKKTVSYLGRFALARYTTSGSLDATFGSSGMVTTSFPASDYQAVINTLLLRSDGEIVAVGDVSANVLNNFASVALAVYKSNGALDKSFGSSGTVVDNSLTTSTTNANPGGGTTTVYKFFTASGGALESDNSVLVAGSYVTETKVTTTSGSVSWTLNERDLALVHYLANGQRDLTFGSAGIAVTPITPTGVTTSNAGGTNVVLQSDGAIVVVGTAAGSSGYTDFLVARYNSKRHSRRLVRHRGICVDRPGRGIEQLLGGSPAERPGRGRRPTGHILQPVRSSVDQGIRHRTIEQ